RLPVLFARGVALARAARGVLAGRRGGGVGSLVAAGADQLIGGADELVVTGNERQAHGDIGQHGDETGTELGGGLEHSAGDGRGRLGEGACVLARGRLGGELGRRRPHRTDGRDEGGEVLTGGLGITRAGGGGGEDAGDAVAQRLRGIEVGHLGIRVESQAAGREQTQTRAADAGGQKGAATDGKTHTAILSDAYR